MSERLPRELFGQVIDATPLVSIDLVIQDAQGQVLLGKRVNRPAKGFWFVPGGRVRKNEMLDEAFQRLTNIELGIELSRNDATLLGVYQHLYEDNALEIENVSTHYVVIAYKIKLNAALPNENVRLDDQHSDQRWWSEQELLLSSEVHANTKAYFDARFSI
jgi:colanic acid biosynthesis protein WcaH